MLLDFLYKTDLEYLSISVYMSPYLLLLEGLIVIFHDRLFFDFNFLLIIIV